MSGHSKWSTIKRQKGAKDAARGALFTRLGNAIAIAARSGEDPEMNFALRLAVDKLRQLTCHWQISSVRLIEGPVSWAVSKFKKLCTKAMGRAV